MSDPISRIREGDRDAAASFVTANSALIRRRYRQKLSRRARRLCDSQDLLATILRRFDRLVHEKGVRASSMEELWSLIFTIGDNAMIDKARIVEKLHRVEGPDSLLAYELRCRLARAERIATRLGQEQGLETELDELLRSIPDSTNRQILTMWLMGHSHDFIADDLGVPSVTVRQRWHRLREQLRGDLGKGTS
jgi:DNA-directed RNA polymerase specialized sigma24 family protein